MPTLIASLPRLAEDEYHHASGRTAHDRRAGRRGTALLERQPLQPPNQPVVGVNWYEAMAYAAWLSSVTGQAYRLPTEAEWEWAARRSVRRYPWGNDWDADRCNWRGSRLNRGNPVGVYPHGATPDGRLARTGGQCL